MPYADPTNPRGMSSLPSNRRSRGEDPYPVESHRWNAVPEDYRTIEGWGADLDPANRPMVPMELPSTVETVRGEVQHRQWPTHPIFISNEMPDLTPVFGTSCPPQGLSGAIRRFAFEYGEGTTRHWMTLILADRVNMVESMIGALLRGKPDNIVAEKAWITRLTGGNVRRRRRILMACGAVVMLAYRSGVTGTLVRRVGPVIFTRRLTPATLTPMRYIR